MRKYQEQRDESRGLTGELCLVLALTVIGTIAISSVAMAGVATVASQGYLGVVTDVVMPAGYWRGVFYDRIVQCGLFTFLAVVGTALYKMWQLADDGGRSVARSLGGTRLGDLSDEADRRRVLNVVEELAIATGIRPPPVFVLKDEPGINAFVAGFDAKDAVIGVTQGAIDRLERQQLQGVLAHEFSHIMNGDMRLNIQLLGVLTGVQAISFAARYLLRLAFPTTAKIPTDRHPLGMLLALIFGAALWPIGQIGSLFATLIHLAMNRQREFLADASAVQYTRDPIGLREALEILLADDTNRTLAHSGAQLASYMFFAQHASAWQRLLHTHPPLEERIRRIDPLGEFSEALTPKAADPALSCETRTEGSISI